MDIYLLNNQNELYNEERFVLSDPPNWNGTMSFDNRSIVTMTASGWREQLFSPSGYSYNRHWVKKLIPAEEETCTY